MREKLLWSTIVLLGVVLIASHAQSPARPESQIGRYQIVVMPSGSGEQAQVFRLDTATGKTLVKAVTTDNALAWAAAMPETSAIAHEVTIQR